MKLLHYYVFILTFNCFAVKLTQSVCPRICECKGDELNCSGINLRKIPRGIPDTAVDLNLDGNVIHYLSRGPLNHLTRLRNLSLCHSELRAVSGSALSGLRSLESLYLKGNKIMKLDRFPKHLGNLKILSLENNEIASLRGNVFLHLKNLQKLYLNNNNLKRLTIGNFGGLEKLNEIFLDSNHIKVIQIGSFSPAVNLNTLSLFNNLLRTIPPDEFESLPKLTTLHIDKNNFSCDCSLLRTFETLKQRQVIVTGVSCRTYQSRTCPVPRIATQNKIAVLGQPYMSFDCANNKTPIRHDSMSWYVQDNKIVRNKRMSILHNGTLIIKNIQSTDAGLYKCKTKNIHGEVDYIAELIVMVPPEFLEVPQEQTVSVGDTAKFTCVARGTPQPQITWYRHSMNSNNVIANGDNNILSKNNQDLTIKFATVEDEGKYICKAGNSEGSIDISTTLKVINHEGPHIVVKPVKTDTFKGTTVQIPCEVESNTQAVVEWMKDGSHIADTNRIMITSLGSLIITNVTLNETGLYECIVYNEYGKDKASAFITVKDYVLPGEEYVNKAITSAMKDVDEAINNTMEYMFTNNSRTVNVHDLFKISRYPNAPARDLARAAEIYERTLERLRDYIHSGRNATTAESFDYKNILSSEHLEIVSRLSGCTAFREQNNCSDTCYHSQYRTIDGSCNNLANPMWGSSLTGFRRILAPIYENSFSQPIGWNKNRKYNGFTLPSSRLVSFAIISTNEITQDAEITHMVMQWGQFLDHDIDHALPSVSSQTWDGVDCKKTCDYAAPCFPIDVPPGDPRIHNRRCIDFIRTSAVCGSGMTSALYGKLQVREQINQLTSYIDASQVYGFEKTIAEDLRDLRNENGLLREGFSLTGSKPMLPTTGINAMDCRLNLEESTRACFVTGDIRANEQVGLAAMHTIWMREHNRLATILKDLNPSWNGDKVYQEARKIVGAQMQHITFAHWLPIILGPEGYEMLGKYDGYKSDINPSISNVFATAALRFGHTMINPELNRFDENFETIPQGPLLLRNAFFAPWRLMDEGGVDPLIRGMYATPAKLKTPKQNLNSELTEKLFHSVHAVALDLAAINIQRGRDHAIPFYTKWRRFCNMSEVHSFDDLKHEISDSDIRRTLEELYGSVHNIDVWVGGVLEDTVDGGKIGPLIRCLLLEQFKRLRDGDRFWYENPNTFTPNQLEEIKKTSLARVICDNGDNIDTIADNVFIFRQVPDDFVSCEEIPSMDLGSWIDDGLETKCGNNILTSDPPLSGKNYISISNTPKSDPLLPVKNYTSISNTTTKHDFEMEYFQMCTNLEYVKTMDPKLLKKTIDTLNRYYNEVINEENVV